MAKIFLITTLFLFYKKCCKRTKIENLIIEKYLYISNVCVNLFLDVDADLLNDIDVPHMSIHYRKNTKGFNDIAIF